MPDSICKTITPLALSRLPPARGVGKLKEAYRQARMPQIFPSQKPRFTPCDHRAKDVLRMIDKPVARRDLRLSNLQAFLGTAYSCVHCFAVAIAAFSSSFHDFATSGASGSSGFGAPRRAWIERRIVRICRAGDQLSRRNRNRN